MLFLRNIFHGICLIYFSGSLVSKISIGKNKKRNFNNHNSIRLLLLTIVLVINTYSSFIFPQTQIRQAYYYFDAVNGNNSNNGRTPQTAKKDLAGLNALGSNIEGKTVAFRDSMYYRGSYTIDQNNVTLTNWWIGGSDRLPRFTSSIAVINWSNFSGSVWFASGSSSSAVWLMYGDSSVWGRQASSMADLTKEGDYYFSGSTMYLYCPQDPDIFYESVNRESGSSVLEVEGTNNTIEYLECFGATSFIIYGAHSSVNLIVQHCVVHHAGTYANLLPGGGAHCIQIRGNNSIIRHSEIFEGTNHGIHVWSNSESIYGIIIEHNNIYNTHHTGIDQNGSYPISGTIIRYNKVGQTRWARERQFPGYPSDGNLNGGIYTANSGIINSVIAYNLIYNTYNKTGVFLNGGSGHQVYNNTVVNPVAYSGGGYGPMYSNSSTNLAKNNIVVNYSNRPCWSGSWSGSSANNISYNFGTGSASGGGSTIINPQFVSLSNWDFHLQLNSPAINHGTELGFTTDLDGNPIIGLPDAGCYESLEYGSYIIIHEGWNFLSVPKLFTKMTPDSLFPTRISPVMGFNGLYHTVNNLENGKGYVVKFEEPEYIFIEGTSVFFPIQVFEGWNLIGPFDEDVSLLQINTTPPGIINSDFFSFNGTQYVAEIILKPGKGYWIKVTEDGLINFDDENFSNGKQGELLSRIEQNWGKIIFTDNDGKSITLYASEHEINKQFYELPPVLPEGIFDVRYSNGTFVEKLNESKVIQITSANYPITVKTDRLTITLKDRTDGNLFNAELKEGEGIQISNNKITSLEVTGSSQVRTPVTYELLQNYPNPFNPSTTINFSIPNESHVNLNIYNVLGELITTLVNEELKPGYYEYEFNASNLASGVYLYKITARDFVETKKMILLR